MQSVAVTGAAAGLTAVASAQEDETVLELDGDTPGWIGLSPEAIEGEENPTLELETGETYEVVWENVDGLPHNFAILSGDGEQLVRSDVIEGEGETQTVEFEVTEEMAEYYCEIHPDTMRGDIELVDAEPEEDPEAPIEGIPVAGDFPEGETVGLEKVAEDLPALTELTYAPGEEDRQYLVTQTGQIYIHEETPGEGPPEETPGEGPPEEMPGEGPPEETPPEETLPAEDPGVATPEDMTPFLDIEDEIVDLGLEDLAGYDERGLLGLAFHPDYQQNGRFYVRYSAPPREDTDEGYDHTDVLAEFTAEGDEADPESERTILEIPQPQDNHNGGRVAFGPDGYLYTSVGDGGNVHDIGPGHVDDWYDENEGGNGQDTEHNLLGGILRIDVDADLEEDPEAPDGDQNPENEEEMPNDEDEPPEEEPDLDPEQIPDREAYEIPPDNPLVDEEGHLEEHYAWGFRNPWGMTIDDEGTLFVADAGQHLVESVYIVEAGGNYSWNVKEGSFCFSPETPVDPPAECPDETPEEVRGGEPLRDPIAEYAHMRGTEAFIDSSVVVGGHRYAGTAIPELEGSFVFANWSSEGVVAADGEILVASDPATDDEMDPDDPPADDTSGTPEEYDGEEETEQPEEPEQETEPAEVDPHPEPWDLEELVIDGAEDGKINRYIYGVDRDATGELYVLTNADYRPEPPTGEVYRIVPAGEGEEVPPPETVETVDDEPPENDA